MKAVSIRAVIGSAVSESRTGRDNPIRVRWGFSKKGWALFFIWLPLFYPEDPFQVWLIPDERDLPYWWMVLS
jgi:hypothetical protein